jgi:uncharacterized protein (TIGR03083 family)
MKLAPRYDGPVVLVIDDTPDSQLVPVTRQRRRFQAMLAELTDDQWAHASRCDGWTARDVVVHLVTVNEFWNLSVVAGAAGEPTRVLAGFDPAATPPLLVDTMRALSPGEVLDRFVATNDAFLAALAALTTDEWSMPAESPPGHVPIRLLAQHALWDSWVHERDVALPLGITPAIEPDEVASCLRYAAALSPALALTVGRVAAGGDGLAVEATDPPVRFVLDVGDSVSLRDAPFDHDAPCLRGDAVEMTEALSLRAPMAPDAPMEWTRVRGGLEAAFDAE